MSDEVQRSLGRIEGALGEVKDLIERHFDDDNSRFSAIHDRLGRIEKKTWAAGGVISLVVAYLTTKLSGH